MIIYKLLPMKIHKLSQVCYVSTGSYLLCNTLDNWYSAYSGPTRSKVHKTVVCECLFIHKLASIHRCTVTVCFLIFD